MEQSNDVMKFYYPLCACIHVHKIELKWKHPRFIDVKHSAISSSATWLYFIVFVVTTITISLASFQLNNKLSALIRQTRRRKRRCNNISRTARLNKPQLFSVTTEWNIRHTSAQSNNICMYVRLYVSFACASHVVSVWWTMNMYHAWSVHADRYS